MIHPRGSSCPDRSGALVYIFPVFACILACIIICGTVGGESTQDPAWPVSVTDDSGTLVTMDRPPERIISLAPSNTELLFALGLDDRIIGVTDYCDYPGPALLKEKIGGFSTVSLEKVTALRPDLVCAAEGNNPDTVQRLRSLGIQVYLVDVTSMEEILRTISVLGHLTGTSAEAERIIRELSDRSAGICATAEDLPRRPVVAHIIWNDPLYISGGGTFQDELIRLSGGVNAFERKEGHQITGIEEFLHADPDLLLINAGSGMGGNTSDLAEWFREEPRLSGLHAVQEGRLIVVDADMADRAGPRLWDLLEEIAPQIRDIASYP